VPGPSVAEGKPACQPAPIHLAGPPDEVQGSRCLWLSAVGEQASRSKGIVYVASLWLFWTCGWTGVGRGWGPRLDVPGTHVG
jgi:hypothetical protein